MASITNLEDLPQLVMEKITSFLDHKQLLAFEQVSRKLKCAVDAHFSLTDHIIIGHLPEVEYYVKVAAKGKKCLNGLLQTMKRCGMRLRTIQITYANQFPSGAASIHNYSRYWKHFLASTEVSNNCPNIENILASPNVNIITKLDHDMFRQQNVLLDIDDAEIYSDNIKLSTDGTCRLRSIKLSYRWETDATAHSYQSIVSAFPNLEQISVCNPNENFYDILPQLMDNGLKGLSIILEVDLRVAKKLFNICKDLKTLRFGLYVESIADISALNTLQLPENVELKIEIISVNDFFSHLNENVCNAIINCEAWGPTDYTLMSKLKNLQQFILTNSEQLQVIAEGSFPKMTKIQNKCHLCDVNNCVSANTCHSQTFLPQLLINKGNQLTHIEIIYVCQKSMPVVWKALKHCKAVQSIRFHLVQVDSSSTVTYEDVAAICDLPNLQHFIFSIQRTQDSDSMLRARLCALLERAVKEHTDFQFKHKIRPFSFFSLYRSKF